MVARSPVHRLLGLGAVLALVGGLSLSAAQSVAQAASLSSIEKALEVRGAKLLDYCRAKGYKNIGVLKFRVKLGDEPISDNVGTLNSMLATRLELALILANDVSKPIGIVKDASEVLAKDKQANHLNPEGQKRLFAHAYPMAWGNEQVTPDLFITGLAKFTPDMREMTVQLCAVANDGKGLFRCMEEFKATPSVLTVPEVGRSFLRSIGGTVKEESAKEFQARAEKGREEIVKAADEVKKGIAPNPADLKKVNPPITLDVLYGGQPIKYDIVGGEARVAEPQAGQPVALVLTRLSTEPGRLGVVVKVNGENTLFRQKDADLFCSKWLLDPGDAPVKIVGFQIDANTTNPFVVLSPEESKAQEINYGKDVGTITVTVFKGKPVIKKEAVAAAKPNGGAGTPAKPEAKKPETPKPETPKPATPPAKDAPATKDTPAPPSDLPASEPPPGSPEETAPLRSIRRGAYPQTKESPKDLGELKYLIKNKTTLRGLVVGASALAANEIQFADFEPDPEVVMTLVIRYYKGK